MTTVDTNYKDLIKNIKASQDIEKELYSDLDALPPNAELNRQKLIVDKINNTSQSRINLFKNLFALNSLLSRDITDETTTLQAKTQMLQTIEEELNRQKAQMTKEKDLNIRNLRLTEINTYYSQKYNAYYMIFQKIVYTCIVLLVVILLRQRYLISSNVSHLLAIIVVVVGLFLIVPTLFDLSFRNNMVFSQYDYSLRPDTEHPSDNTKSGKQKPFFDFRKYEKDLELLAEGVCLGSRCCGPGQEYDRKKAKCVISSK